MFFQVPQPLVKGIGLKKSDSVLFIFLTIITVLLKPEEARQNIAKCNVSICELMRLIIPSYPKGNTSGMLTLFIIMVTTNHNQDPRLKETGENHILF